MSKVVQAYFRLLKMTVVMLLVAMVIMVFANVVMRYAFNSGLPVSEELSRWAFVWMVFLGSILVVQDRAHLGVDLVVNVVQPKVRKALFVISNCLMLYATWLILLGSIEQTQLNMETVAPASGLSQAWLFGIGVVFSVSSGFILLYQLYQLLRTPAGQVLPLAIGDGAGAE